MIYQVLFNIKEGIAIRSLFKYNDSNQKDISYVHVQLKSDVKEVDGLLKIIASFNS